jgi:hypothetical protein
MTKNHKNNRTNKRERPLTGPLVIFFVSLEVPENKRCGNGSG